MTDPMFDVEANRAYWTTVAQVAGVFAIPLVLEARRAVARWESAKRSTRRVQSLFFFSAALIILQTVITSLTRIHEPEPDDVSYVLSLIGIFYLAFGLIYAPVIQYFVSANADWAEIIRRALPWSKWRAGRRDFRKEEKRFHRAMGEVHANLATLNRMLVEAKEMLATAKKQDATIAAALNVYDIRLIPEDSMPEGLRETHAELESLSTDGAVDRAQKVVRQIKKARKRVLATIAQGDKFTKQFEEGRERERMSYLSPDLMGIFEAEVSKLSNDARDDIFPTPKTYDFEATAKEVQDETSQSEQDLKKLQE